MSGAGSGYSCADLGLAGGPAAEDAYFRMCAGQYRQALHEVGILPGWRVLDAGCGGGLFSPWIARLVGRLGLPGGHGCR